MPYLYFTFKMYAFYACDASNIKVLYSRKIWDYLSEPAAVQSIDTQDLCGPITIFATAMGPYG
jgi:hypothetical protein